MKKILPPKTVKDEVKELLHGVEVVDPYRWLEDVNNTKVQTWLDEQSKYTRSILDTLTERESLRKEFDTLFRADTLGFPHSKNGRYFMMKRKADEDLAVLYVQEGLYGKPRVLVNPNVISKERGYTVNLTGYNISKDAKLITYRLSEAANDQSTAYVMNVDTGKDLEDKIPAELYPMNASWSYDNKGFWYTRRKEKVPKGEEKFHKKIYYHTLGTEYTEDKLIFGENLAKEDRASASATYDGLYLIVSVSILSKTHWHSEIYLLDLKNQSKGFVPVVQNIMSDKHDVFFSGLIHRGYMYIKNNFNSPKWKIERVAIADINKGMSAWQTIIPEKDDRVIKSYSATKDKLFVTTLENVHSVLREYSLEGIFKKEIPFPTLGSSSSVSAEHEGEEGFFSFSSFAYPATIFRIDMHIDAITVFEQQKVKVDINSIEAKQVWYPSKDGTKIPMFLIHKKNIKLTGHIPTMLYGYGGFNISQTPSFLKSILPFIEKGGVYAIANIRGGGEFGEAWHEAGTKKQKQNTFDDFIAAAEWLISNKYTNSNHLGISGGSNGGLLVGAVMNQRPELFKAVIMSVPVADMLRYHLFHGGKLWIPDYGSPEDKDMFPYLLKYSPYHNVKDSIKYPATMIVTSDQDDRVHPGQSFKMTARLQEANSSDNPIMLRVERKSGHSGAADISRYINLAVDEWSFIFSQIGDGFTKK